MSENVAEVQGLKLPVWRLSLRTGLSLAIIFLPVALIFSDGLAYMADQWFRKEEYSHGILIPFITAFLIWQKKNELAHIPFAGSWPGFGLAALGLALYFLGELSTLYIIVQYAFLIVVFGVVMAVMGPRIFKETWVPLSFLFFAIPLPNFLYQGLSAQLQLLSSQLGVAVIRLFDISVYLEGNVIDLGTLKLQVVEACNGLRYLFPLMSLAFICAFFFKAALWKRAVIFLSSVPITILMNSFRIGVIGVLVEYWGKSMAEGFLHDFEGWIIFMACTGILIGEMWVLAQVGKEPRALMEVFGLTLPGSLPENARFQERALPRQFWALGLMLLAALGLSATLERREERVPARADFAGFPLHLDAWSGQRQVMEQQYIDTLKFDDYIMANYVKEGSPSPVNFYSAYYASQRKGESIHSPRSCIPGGGWQITSLETKTLDGISFYGAPLKVNRLTIQKGEDRQLVYYWFQQRGRNLTNEYMAKWYLFWDALTRNRSDGALVRLTTYAPKGDSLEQADQRLVDFLGKAMPGMDRYIAR